MKLGTGCGHCVRCTVFKSAEIHHLSDQRPHLMVVASDGAHAIPRALIQSVIDGKQPSTILTESVVQRIIEEWLQKVTA
jgi:predicted transcriptional regulator